ncbi:hypothetical protein SKAU_G00139540 [Synaphobranchus kaupii]|uniref:Uncharacterized protein n=1 Tax=Synaphobranchus kaupii TaxID=118154 RepID=A0A9Q1FSZ5_SYNKA|nr:hypothetical protein SKAU_G00139540 [Synaphobranchus kaupii]
MQDQLSVISKTLVDEIRHQSARLVPVVRGGVPPGAEWSSTATNRAHITIRTPAPVGTIRGITKEALSVTPVVSPDMCSGTALPTPKNGWAMHRDKTKGTCTG